MPTPTHEDRRCRRGERCARRARVDTPTEPDGPVVFTGTLLADPRDGFCPGCTGRLELALSEFPRLYASLNLLHLPSLAVRYRPDDITGGGLLHSPTLLNDHVADLALAAAHELDTWAERVADLAGVDWDSQLAARSRDGHRVQVACQLLGYRVVQWLRAGEHEYRARSAHEDPTRGHDPNTITAWAGDHWCRLDGPAAAIRFLDLHRQAVRLTGGAPSDHVPVPCGYCGAMELRREHTACIVRCRACGSPQSDDAYEAVIAAALAAFGTGVGAAV